MGRRWKSPLQLLSMLSFKGNKTPGNRILNFPYEFSYDFFLTLVTRMKIHCKTVLYTHDERNEPNNVLHMSVTDGRWHWTVLLRWCNAPYKRQ